MIERLFCREKKRLVTLLGTGGIGKTRLAWELSRKLDAAFPHGARFVPLESAADVADMTRILGQHLGLTGRLAHSWMEALVDHLTEQEGLLVLDNLEQIRGARAVIRRILTQCPEMRILATSRAILGLPQEVEYALDSLNRPNPHLFPEPEDLLQFEAIALFVQKAREVAPDFKLHPGNARPIVAICHKLEGMPLPIELAAARIKLLTPEAISRQLDTHANRVLKTTQPGVTPRHQTIRHTIRWSYDLLSETEKEQFQQLALFRDRFSLAALEDLFPAHDPLDLVENFINQSLLLREKEPGRFRLLKLLRDFGLDQLKDNPRQDAYRNRFAQYFANLVRQGQGERAGSSKVAWLDRVQTEYENIWAAMQWLQTHSPDAAASLGAHWWPYYLHRGLLREGLELLESLLPLPLEDQETKARLYEGAGTLAHNSGNSMRARDYFEHSLQTWQALDLPGEIARATNNLGWAAWRLGQYDQTIALAEQALAYFQEHGDRAGEAKARNNMAWAYFHQGLLDNVPPIQREVLAIHRDRDHPRGVAFARTNLAWALAKVGKRWEAEPLVVQSIRELEAMGDRQLTAFSRLVRVDCLLEHQAWETAQAVLASHCLPAFEEIGDIWGIANTHYRLGRLANQNGSTASATFHLGQAMVLFKRSNDAFGEGCTALELGKASLRLDRAAEAETYFGQALTLGRQTGARELLREVGLAWSLLLAGQDRPRLALTLLAIADAAAEEMGGYCYEHHFRKTLRDQPDPKLAKQLAKALPLTTLPKMASKWEPIRRLAKQGDGRDLGRRAEGILDLLQARSSEEAVDPLLDRVLAVVRAKAHDPCFLVEHLCREVGMSYSQLNRRLQKGTGHTPAQCIRAERLRLARKRLTETNDTIAAVACDSGFKDPEYFYRVFRKAMDMTPGAFRKKHRP